MVKKKITDLISSGALDEALDLLLLVAEANDEKHHNELIILSSQLNGNNRNHNLGIIEYESFKQENNRISLSILNYAQEVFNSDYFKEMTSEGIEKYRANRNEKKLKILFVASNPLGTTKFQLEKEYLDIRRIFNRNRKRFDVTESFETTLDQLFETVKYEKPDILHISAPSTDKYLLMHRPDHTIRSVPYNVLSSAFIMFEPYVKCVLFNTWCSTIFLKKISTYLQFAIGSKGLVPDQTSILFTSGFYTAIAQGKKFNEAYLIGIEVLEKLSISRIPFVIFSNGLSNDPNDRTPEDFDIREPEEILKRLGIK